jgi:O-antigen/teichoic acid export membrane protein
LVFAVRRQVRPRHSTLGADDAVRRDAQESEIRGSSAGTPGERVPMDGIARNAVFAMLAQVTTGIFTTAVTIYLVRALGTEGLGLFALALSVGRLALLVADLGIPLSLSRFLAETGGDRRLATYLYADALRLKVVTAAVASAGLFAVAGPIAGAYNEPGLVWPLRGIALSLFAESLLGLYVAAFVALGRNVVNLRLTFFESLAEAVAIVTLVALGAGATGAAFGRAIGYTVGALAATWVVLRVFGRALVVARGGRTREIATYAAPLLLSSGVYSFYAQVDVLIIGAMLGSSAVGIFAAPLRLTIPLSYVGQALANSVAPRQAASSAGPSVRAFEVSLRWLIIAQAALIAPIVVWPDEIVRLLLGQEFAESAEVLRVLAAFIFLRGLSPLISTTVNYLGRARQRIPIVLTALGANVAIDVALLPRIGVVGAAIGTTVAYWIYVPAHFFICWRELGVHLRPLAVTCLRALVAAAAMGGVLLAVGTGSITVVQLVVGSLAGTLAYGAALMLTREISPSELRRGRRAVSMGLSRLLAPSVLR